MKENWKKYDVRQYGIVRISVAGLRAQSCYQSEMVDQILLGTILPLFEMQNDFYYTRNWDGYWGWINKHAVVVGDRQFAQNWQNAPHVLVMEISGSVFKTPDFHERLVDVVPCVVLKKVEEEKDFTRVELPDGSTGWIQNQRIVDEAQQEKITPTPKQIVSIARKFLGLPYLWGGNSTKGFDCSGFVQTVFRLINIWLPRNASQMVKLGEEIPVSEGYKNLRGGDLLFFGNSLFRITHVALSLGGSLFMHAEGTVKINSLDPTHELYNEYRHSTFLKARRLL